jgi:hypothetical protein
MAPSVSTSIDGVARLDCGMDTWTSDTWTALLDCTLGQCPRVSTLTAAFRYESIPCGRMHQPCMAASAFAIRYAAGTLVRSGFESRATFYRHTLRRPQVRRPAAWRAPKRAGRCSPTAEGWTPSAGRCSRTAHAPAAQETLGRGRTAARVTQPCRGRSAAVPSLVRLRLCLLNRVVPVQRDPGPGRTRDRQIRARPGPRDPGPTHSTSIGLAPAAHEHASLLRGPCGTRGMAVPGLQCAGGRMGVVATRSSGPPGCHAQPGWLGPGIRYARGGPKARAWVARL